MTDQLSQFTAIIESLTESQMIKQLRDESRGLKLKAANGLEYDRWSLMQSIVNALADYRDNMDERRSQREASGDSFD